MLTATTIYNRQLVVRGARTDMPVDGHGRSRNLQQTAESVHARLQSRACFSVYYYTKCVLLKAGCTTLKKKVCNIKFLR